MFGTAALPLLHATMAVLSIPRAAVMMILVIHASCFLEVLQHIPNTFLRTSAQSICLNETV